MLMGSGTAADFHLVEDASLVSFARGSDSERGPDTPMDVSESDARDEEEDSGMQSRDPGTLLKYSPWFHCI